MRTFAQTPTTAQQTPCAKRSVPRPLRRPDVNSAQQIRRAIGNQAASRMWQTTMPISKPGREGSTASLPEPLQRSAGNSTLAPMSGDGLLRGGGETLDPGVRRIMEPRLGFDLGDLRVHRGRAAAVATTALNARAFIVGGDIAFGPGEFRPDTVSGQRLLAHELTHLAQQAHTGTLLVQRQPKPQTEPWLTQNYTGPIRMSYS